MRYLTSVVAIFLVMSGSARGQSPNATLNGQVVDSSGGPIAGANIDVVNTATNVKYLAKTNAEGMYILQELPPANYEIQISHTGFKTIVKPDVLLNVRDAVVINFTLPLGAVSERVTVEGGAPLIDTEAATVSTVIDRQFAENLPMNGRSFQTLIQLTPGVVLTPSNTQDIGQFSINGQRPASNYWMLDGVSANIGVGVTSSGFGGNGLAGAVGSFSALGGTNSLVSVDALQEFRILTSTYAPEFGRTPGGQISIVTRSGTNQWHGTLFDYLRNDILDANDWFANEKGLSKPREHQNDFGGTFSGPILRDKTFFFFSYEGLRLRLPQTTLSTVPCDGTCQVFGNARTMAISAMQPYLDAYPLPNGPEVFTPCTPNVNGCPASGQRPTGAAQFNASYSNPATLDAYSLRIDHKLTNKLTLFGRYNYSPSEIVSRGTGGASLSTLAPTRITTQTATVGTTWSISPTTINELRLNYSRTDASLNNRLDTFGGAVPLSSLPFPSPFTSQNGFLVFQIAPLQQSKFNVGHSLQELQQQINVVDSVSSQRGPHSLKFGVDFRRLSPLYGLWAYRQQAVFATVASAANGTPSVTVVNSMSDPTFLLRNIGIYAQDTWRIMPRLTLTYGLRWDVDFVPQSLKGPSFPAVTGFDLNNFSSLALATPGTPPYKTTYRNFAPRLGIAYQVTRSQDLQTVVRGGLGVFYDLASSEVGNRAAPVYPFGANARTSGGTFPLSPAMSAPPPVAAPSASNPGILEAFDPNLKLPYTVEWNVAIEQGVGREQAVSTSYIGSVGRRLLGTAEVFRGTPSFSPLFLVTNAPTSDYHALQVQFRRRLARGLQALASYTWSHSIDTGSAGSTALVSNIFLPSAISGNRGSSDFDIRHAFSSALTYDIPAPRTNAFTNAIVRGWSLQSVIQVRSAPPVDVNDSNFFRFDAPFIADTRPDVVPGQPLYIFGAQYPGGKAFNPAAFRDPPVNPSTGNPARQGTTPRNFLRAFGAAQWDLAIHREFPVRESLKLQFRAELFNVLNHPNFGVPSGCFGAFCGAPFGLSTQMLGQSLTGGNVGGGGFSPLYQLGGPRSVQFALKLFF